jgi:hypothetical protein
MIWLVSSLTYSAIALLTACAGTFGVAASRMDLLTRADEYGRASWHSRDNQITSARWYAFRHTAAGIVGSVLAGIIWPLSVPLWLAWRKGSFVANALQAREELKRSIR